MRQFRAGNEPFRSAGAAPVTRVFSPYVVQAGSARPRVRAGLPRQRSTGLVRRSGRPGDGCPGLSARLVLGAGAGSPSPHRGEGLGCRAGAGGEALVRVASAGQLAAPEAMAGSQPVPWTTMESDPARRRGGARDPGLRAPRAGRGRRAGLP